MTTKLKRAAGLLLAASLLSLALVAAACSDDDSDGDPTPTQPVATATTGGSTTTPSTPTTAPATPTTAQPTATTAQPTPTKPATTGKTIGVPALDSLAKLVVAGDVAGVAALVQYSELACTTAQGAGGPPKCAPGEAAGTVVKVFPFLGCSGEHMRASQVEGMLTAQLKSPTLHSAFKLKDQGTAEFPRGTTGIVFEIEPTSGKAGIVIGTNDAGKVISAYRGCGNIAATELFNAQKGTEVLLAP